MDQKRPEPDFEVLPEGEPRILSDAAATAFARLLIAITEPSKSGQIPHPNEVKRKRQRES